MLIVTRVTLTSIRHLWQCCGENDNIVHCGPIWVTNDPKTQEWCRKGPFWARIESTKSSGGRSQIFELKTNLKNTLSLHTRTQVNQSCLWSGWVIHSRKGKQIAWAEVHVLRISQNRVGTKKNVLLWVVSQFMFSHHLRPPVVASKHSAVVRARVRRESQKQERTLPPLPSIPLFLFAAPAHARHSAVFSCLTGGLGRRWNRGQKNSKKNFEPKTIFVLSNFEFWHFF